jgi:hypothetical protein
MISPMRAAFAPKKIVRMTQGWHRSARRFWPTAHSLPTGAVSRALFICRDLFFLTETPRKRTYIFSPGALALRVP